MRSVFEEQSPLLERLHHQGQVALLQVAHAAVDELRAPAGRAFAEIALLQQQHGVPASSRVECHADACGAPTGHDHVP